MHGYKKLNGNALSPCLSLRPAEVNLKMTKF